MNDIRTIKLTINQLAVLKLGFDRLTEEDVNWFRNCGPLNRADYDGLREAMEGAGDISIRYLVFEDEDSSPVLEDA